MESKQRTIAKAISWQFVGLFGMVAIAWMFTGSLDTSLSVAVFSCLSGAVFFFVHERIWQRVHWGLKRPD